MSRTRLNLSLILVGVVLLSALAWVGRPYLLLDETALGARANAHIVSIEPVRSMYPALYLNVAKLSIRFEDGQTAIAAASEKQVVNCSVGDSVVVRLLPSKKSGNRLYRVISKSCSSPDR
ncbi:MAG: hypothetical protein QUV08_11615 [Parasphingorhabdus sp.]|nr:hypothetical protein [Parasphingorhabdus sp.]